MASGFRTASRSEAGSGFVPPHPIRFRHEPRCRWYYRPVTPNLSTPLEHESKRSASSITLATAVGLAIALFLPIPPYREPFLHLLINTYGLSWISAWESIGVVSKMTVILGLPLLVVYWERRPLASIGIRHPSIRDLLAMTAILVAYLLIIPFVNSIAYRVPAIAAQLAAGGRLYGSLPPWLNWFGLTANGIAEEIGFRGYAIERIEELTGSALLGASVPFIINVLVHAGVWGPYGMLQKAPILLLFVILYLWRRNLPVCAVAHVLIDIFVFKPSV
jgi:membrane protease YdiL (CAAX protease family)